MPQAISFSFQPGALRFEQQGSEFVFQPWVFRLKKSAKDGSGICCNGRSHSSSSYVGTGFIGGEDQGYIACP